MEQQKQLRKRVPKQPASPGTQAAHGLVAEGAHIALRAEVGRTRNRLPLVVPSYNGKLVAPDPGLEEERGTYCNPRVIRALFFLQSSMELHASTDAACYRKQAILSHRHLHGTSFYKKMLKLFL